MMLDLDKRLQNFIADPQDFLVALGLVHAFHQETVMVSRTLEPITLDGQKVVPVFTDPVAVEAFKKHHRSTNQDWQGRLIPDVLRETISKELSGLVFNLRKDGLTHNTTLMLTGDMMQFINHHTRIINTVLGENNQKASLGQKVYLVPAYQRQDKNGNVMNFFALITNPDGEHYVPVFSSLVSFARWYHDERFGVKFREQNGKIFVWNLGHIQSPPAGKNILEETTGIVINPFDDTMALFGWESLPE